MAMRLCYLSRNYKAPASGGGKAKSDIEKTLAEMGAVNIGLERTTRKSKIYDFFRTFRSVVTALRNIRRDDVIVLQYPVKKYFALICHVAHLRKAKVIALIHDLGSFRRRSLTVEEEITRLNHADLVIAANPHQREWLLEKGCRALITVYGLHDYLTDEELPANHTALQYDNEGNPRFSLYFVGNLAPHINRYLYTLGEAMQHTELYLYGSGFDSSQCSDTSTIRMVGFARDTDLMTAHRGDFGISWYGDSLDGAAGRMGDYMEMNTPHKLSLYLRAGTPIVIWRRAAMAPTIEREGIGLVVDTLAEVESRLEQLTKEEYQQMQQNVKRIAQEIAQGASCRRAIREAYKILGGDLVK